MLKLSIITVNLNNKDGLINTAESIITQTWTHYEWIIIDGGSTDGSVEVIKDCKQKTDKLVYWCSEKDGGIYQGMNKGISKASGEYCWFLNSGDCVYKETTLAEIFTNDFDEDIVFGNVKNEKRNIENRLFYDVESPSFWIHYTIPHQSALVKLELKKKIGGFDTNYLICSDKYFLMLAIFKCHAKIKYLTDVFSITEPNGISELSENKTLLDSETMEIFKKIFPFPFSHLYFHFISSFKYGKMSMIFLLIRNRLC